MQLPEQCALLGIVLVCIHNADDLAAVHHRCRSTAQKRLSVISAVKSVISPQRPGDLCVEGVLPPCIFLLAAVVEHTPRRICNHYTAYTGLLQAQQRLFHIGLR